MSNYAPTLGDVATRAGVSKSTVSRVLNNKIGNGFSVTDEVRQRVLDVAEILNYRPNLIAQSLTNQQIRMISILGGAHALGDLGNIYQTIVNSATRILDSAPGGFDVTVDMSRHKPDSSELPAWRVDGVIILAKCTTVTVSQLEQTRIPYVVVNGPCGPGGSSVVPDDVGGTRQAIRHLVELGHRRIAYAGPAMSYLAGHSSLADRHNTYLSEMSQNGLEVIPGHDKPLESAAEFIESAVVKSEATAIVAYGHMEGLNIMQAAHTLGIAVPRQLSLVCFCDEYANSVMSPGLTFIDLGSKAMGRAAAALLLKKIKQSKEPKSECIKLDVKLVLRESTAPPVDK